MWSDEYESLSNYEKDEFRRIANNLLSHTYLVKYRYQPSKKMTEADRDYQFAARHYSLLEEYFAVTGWRLEINEVYGFISLLNIYDNNRYRMDQFTTLFLYTCRLIYEEQRDKANSFHTVITSTYDIVEKMKTLGLLQKERLTKKARLEAQRAIAHYNIIDKMESTAWDPDGNQVLILPSILSVITNQGINDMVNLLEELRSEQPDAGAAAADAAVDSGYDGGRNL